MPHIWVRRRENTHKCNNYFPFINYRAAVLRQHIYIMPQIGVERLIDYSANTTALATWWLTKFKNISLTTGPVITIAVFRLQENVQ